MTIKFIQTFRFFNTCVSVSLSLSLSLSNKKEYSENIIKKARAKLQMRNGGL